MSIDRAVQFGNDMVDAFINSGMNVEPALGLTEEYRGNDESKIMRFLSWTMDMRNILFLDKKICKNCRK